MLFSGFIYFNQNGVFCFYNIEDMFYKVNVTINVCGLLCPEPLVKIRRSIRYMDVGEIMLILADDPSIKRDILVFSRFMKHTLLMQITQYVPYCYLLQKKSGINI